MLYVVEDVMERVEVELLVMVFVEVSKRVAVDVGVADWLLVLDGVGVGVLVPVGLAVVVAEDVDDRVLATGPNWQKKWPKMQKKKILNVKFELPSHSQPDSTNSKNKKKLLQHLQMGLVRPPPTGRRA